MSELGIQTRDWWNQGCIKEPAFESCRHAESFENTNTLVATTLGIPFHQLITDKQLDLIKTIKV
jgi:dTDP-4-amino-4,6-dideoxygalactose transaminase